MSDAVSLRAIKLSFESEQVEVTLAEDLQDLRITHRFEAGRVAIQLRSAKRFGEASHLP
jgi:hypothetical protein